MCGICGSSIANDKNVHTIVQNIKHRGPDHQSIWNDHAVTLGHARLSIIDTTVAGNQPFKIVYNGQDHYMVFNGEIYNYKELRKQLSYEWKSDSDTEVLLVGLATHGLSFLHKCHGMWAFAWYTNNKMVLCRDRFGQKPLYYVHDNHLTFSSEMHSLLSISTKKIDPDALNEYLTYRFVTAPRTIIENIKKVDAGEYLEYNLDTNELTCTKYYVPKYKKSKKKYHEKKEDLHHKLNHSITLRLRSDVDVGSFLSGGWDSSIVTTLASSNNLHTYSMGFDTTNELPFARELAEYLNTKHHEYILRDNDMQNVVSKVIRTMDEPVGDPGYVPMYLLCQNATTKVVLTGDGADEIYGGYDRYKLWVYGKYLKHFAVLENRWPIYKKLHDLKGKTDFEAFHSIISVFSDEELLALGVKPTRLSKYWDKNIPALYQAQLFDIKTLLPNDFFMKTDKMGGAHGKEIRTPFFDHKLVEHALSLQPTDCLLGLKEKRILKDCFKQELPEIIRKRKKHGFNVPIDSWFKGDLGTELKELLEHQSLINKKYVLKLLRKPMNNSYTNNFVNAQKLWTIYVLLSWLKHHKVL